MTIYHMHHIIPKHAGGNDDPSNLVRLTVEEHAEAHRQLYEQYGREQDRIAWLGLSGQIDKQEAWRLAHAAGNVGKKQSEETREKRRQSMLGKNTAPKSTETKKKISDALKGKPITQKHKNNIGKGSSCRVICDGIEFASQKEAKEYFDKIGISVSIYKRLESKRFTNWYRLDKKRII